MADTLQADTATMNKIGIIGSGLIGKSWAMLFACSGYDVMLYDVISDQLQSALVDIEAQLSALYKEGLQRSSLTLAEVKGHICTTTILEECVTGAIYIQECVPENRDLKRDVWRQIDDVITPDDVVFATSTSAIVPSLLSDHLKKRHRFMVAHPANPPLLNPMVELVPAPWTEPAAVDRARALMEVIGQVPIVLNKEIDGFVQARIQAAIIHVAWQLVSEDYVDVESLETAMSEGLGGWYAFMGPFDVKHINANGFVDSNKKYGAMVEQVQKTFPKPELMQGPAAEKLTRDLEQWTPSNRLADRCRWRDRRMSALLQLKRKLDEEGKREEPK
ncbi:lambda-crystallin-like [Littorina saxatilis]|uniref:3-hydroxyacyl-CoA dehydrogenase n=2 Tax=Littorina saxatilis TaxID=31220 RepID=A0AAN9G1N6_9CAEN